MFAPKLIHLATAESTNSELSKMIAQQHPDEWTVVSALSQTSGRGQAGNRWETEPGMNICCSICLYPLNVLPAEQFVLSMAVAVGVANYLHGKGLPAQIKWPNDIYINDRKICGILIENQLMGAEICSTVVGIGLNVNQSSFSTDIPNATSLILEIGNLFDPEAELLDMVKNIQQQVLNIYEGKEDAVIHVYHEHLYLRDVQHRFYEGAAVRDGIIRRVAKSGGMTVELVPSGSEKIYFFKEISYLPPR